MSFLNTIKNFIGMETDDEYYDDEYYDEEDEIEEESQPKKSFAQKKAASKVVPINPGSSNRIRIMKPSAFNESTGIADEVKGGRLVIFDVENLDSSDQRRVVDFISGTVYGVSGNIRRVSGTIFVAAPRSVDITGDNFKEHTRNSFDWNI